MLFKIDDKITFKKKHACGSYNWTIVGTGATIKLQCNECKRVISLLPSEVRKRQKP